MLFIWPCYSSQLNVSNVASSISAPSSGKNRGKFSTRGTESLKEISAARKEIAAAPSVELA